MSGRRTNCASANGLKEKIQRLHEEGKHDEANKLNGKWTNCSRKADRVAGEGPREQDAGEALSGKTRRPVQGVD